VVCEAGEVDQVKDMGERRRLFFLILIMTSVSLVVGGMAMLVLYRAAIEQTRERLVVTAQSQARLIEAVARFDEEYSNDYPEGSEAATLAQIRDAHEQYQGFGETGEFTLARREDKDIVFVLRHRHLDLADPRSVPFDSDLAEPMRRAVSGESGTLIGLDYRGEVVVAAYEPVALLNLGIVAKIDLTEVQAPFQRAGLLGLGSGIVVVVLGSLLFLRVSNPMITRLEELFQQAQQELTNRKRSEQELAQLNVKLEQRVDERTKELVDAHEELVRKERLADLGRLAGGMAHELRNPLGVIRNNVYYLRTTAAQLGANDEQCLSDIDAEVTSADRIINELLDYSSASKKSLQLFPLGVAVEKALHTTTIPNSVEVEGLMQNDDTYVRADQGQVERILQNVILNAVQAMPDGGTLSIRCDTSGDAAVVTVADTGIGIDEKDLPNIFEPLYTTKPKGIGLGLAISRRYADLNNGRLEAESELGKGSTFRLTLPLASYAET
jgi:signal transduction histidine kinase